MFWRFGSYANISALETILDKPDATLEELLDEADLLQELKQHNTKLIEFLRNGKNLPKLLQYVIDPKATLVGTSGENDGESPHTGPSFGAGFGLRQSPFQSRGESDEARRARLACEILSSGTWSLAESLMANEQQMRMFWTFLDRDPPLDPLQAAYFTKVNETLLDKKTEEMMNFFMSLENVVPTMLKHVECPMIMDLLLKIISMEKAEGGAGIIDWLQSQDLIPILLSFLSPDSPATIQTSTGDFLKAIITISANASQNEASCIGPNNLTRQLVSDPCVRGLIANMLKGGNPLTVGVGIVIEVIRKNNSDYDPDVSGHEQPPSGRDPIYLGTLLRLFADNVPDFMKLMMNQNEVLIGSDGARSEKKRELKVAFGGTIEPLGFNRFKTCELMAELLHCSNMGLLNERGSDSHVRERDNERERLRMLAEKERLDRSSHSLGPYGYAGLSGGNRPLEVQNGDNDNGSDGSGDDDGFEDVGTADFEDEKKDENSRNLTLEAIQQRNDLLFGEPENISKYSTKSEDCDFVEELLSPISSAKRDKSEYTTVEMATPMSGISTPTISISLASEPAESNPTDFAVDKLQSLTIQDTPPATNNEINSAAATTVYGQTERADQTRNSTSSADDEKLANFACHKSSDPCIYGTSPSDSRVIQQTPEIGHATSSSSLAESVFAPSSTPIAPIDRTNIELPALPPGPQAPPAAPHPPATISSTDRKGFTHDREQHLIDLLSSQIEPDFSCFVEEDIDGRPVVGDYLKIQFVKHKVVITILDFFFRFPWNNFLHNVVYDVVQQVFNGPMERGYNRALAIDLFKTGRITEQIIEGQKASDEAQKQTNMRLGYMGHLTLIAEEVVKFAEKYSRETLSETVARMLSADRWIEYVERTLAETRERDNAILGGVRPELTLGPRASIFNSAGGFGAAADLDTIDLANGTGGVGAAASFGPVTSGGGSGSGVILSGFGNSSDEEDDDMEREDEEEEEISRLGIGASTDQFASYISREISNVDKFGSDDDEDDDDDIPFVSSRTSSLPITAAPLKIQPPSPSTSGRDKEVPGQYESGKVQEEKVDEVGNPFACSASNPSPNTSAAPSSSFPSSSQTPEPTPSSDYTSCIAGSPNLDSESKSAAAIGDGNSINEEMIKRFIDEEVRRDEEEFEDELERKVRELEDEREEVAWKAILSNLKGKEAKEAGLILLDGKGGNSDGPGEVHVHSVSMCSDECGDYAHTHDEVLELVEREIYTLGCRSNQEADSSGAIIDTGLAHDMGLPTSSMTSVPSTQTARERDINNLLMEGDELRRAMLSDPEVQVRPLSIISRVGYATTNEPGSPALSSLIGQEALSSSCPPGKLAGLYSTPETLAHKQFIEGSERASLQDIRFSSPSVAFSSPSPPLSASVITRSSPSPPLPLLQSPLQQSTKGTPLPTPPPVTDLNSIPLATATQPPFTTRTLAATTNTRNPYSFLPLPLPAQSRLPYVTGNSDLESSHENVNDGYGLDYEIE